MLSASSSPTLTVPASPTSPPRPPPDFDFPFTPFTSQSTSNVIPFLDISSPATSLRSLTPPTSLVSPQLQPGLMLSTPSTSVLPPSIPFHLSPSFTSSTPIIDLTDTSSPPSLPIDISLSSLHANLSHHPFIDILPSASTEVFLASQPLYFIPPPPSSTSIYTPVILSPLNHASSVPPLATLPPLLSLLPPSPSSLLIQPLSPSLFVKPPLPPIPLTPPFL